MAQNVKKPVIPKSSTSTPPSCALGTGRPQPCTLGAGPSTSTADDPAVFTCSTDLLQNLQSLFNDTHLSDVTLVVGDKEYPGHKMILATASRCFSNMFYGDWKESTQHKVRLEENPACETVFDQFLKFCYGVDIIVSMSTLVPIFQLADKYEVMTLRKHCEEYAIKSLEDANIEGAVQWLTFAEQINHDNMIKWCYHVIRHNLDEASSLPEWALLSKDQIIKLLNNKNCNFETVNSFIVTKNALGEFHAIEKWLLTEQNKADLEINGKPVLDAVLFQLMDGSQLLDVENSELAQEGSCICSYLKEKVALSNKFLAIQAVPVTKRSEQAKKYYTEMNLKSKDGVSRWYTEKCPNIVEVNQNNITVGTIKVHMIKPNTKNKVKGVCESGYAAQVEVYPTKSTYLFGFNFGFGSGLGGLGRPLIFGQFEIIAYNKKRRVLHVCSAGHRSAVKSNSWGAIPQNSMRANFLKKIQVVHPTLMGLPKTPNWLAYFITVEENVD